MCDGGVMNPIGKISIEQKSNGGEITVKSAGNVTIEASAPGKLTLKGGTGIVLDGGTANVEIKGTAGVQARRWWRDGRAVRLDGEAELGRRRCLLITISSERDGRSHRS